MFLAALIAFKFYIMDDNADKKVIEEAVDYTSEKSSNDEAEDDNTKKTSRSKINKINWKKFNSDTKAFIEIPGVLEYPVTYYSDNEYYLHRGLDKKYKYSGTLFINSDNSSDFKDDNTIIYGHNMTSGSMFGKLKKYKSKSFYKEHKYFYVYTRKTGTDPDTLKAVDEVLKYEIKNISVVNPDSKIYTIMFADSDSKKSYLESFHGLYGNKLDLDKSICTLSTCTNYSRQRLCVQGSLIERKNVNFNKK